MKKVLSFILVLSMVLGSFGMAFAAPAKDEIAGHLNEDATLRLADLGIVKGDDRGFALDSNITRAEFAVLIVRALGLEGSANVAQGETQFTDVTAAAGYEWATGAINVATKLGYIQGYGNGKFGPGDNIKYEDAITLIVRVLGYEPAATAKGGYPIGYLVVAEQEIKNTKHVEGATGVAITRGSVFQLLDNSLTKAKMIQTGYGSETKYVVSGKEDTRKETILTNNLGFDEVEGTVVANHRVEKLKANEIKMNVEKENGVKVDKTTKYAISDKFDFDVDSILGLKVSAWYNDDKEELFRYEVATEEDEVVYGTVVSNEEDKKTLKVEVRDGKNSTKKYEWAERDTKNDIEAAVVYLQNETEDVEDIKAGAYGKFVLNEYGDVAFAYLFNFDTDKVGMAQEVKNDEIKLINLELAKEDVIELDDAEEVFVFNSDFTKASLEDIEAGTAVFGWEDEDDNFFIVIKNDRVEGKLEEVRVSNNRVKVGGENITRAANAIFSGNQGEDYTEWNKDNFEEVEEFIDEEITLVLNLEGRAMVLTTDVNVTSGNIYGLATYLTTGRNPVLTVFTSEGKEVDYKFEDRKDAEKVENKVSTDYKENKYAAVEFKVNKDGEIVKGKLETVEDTTVELQKAEKQRFVTIGTTAKKYNIRTNTVVIKALNNKGELKPSVIKYDDIIAKSFKENGDAFVIGEVGKDAKLIVFVESEFQAKEDLKYGVVTGVPARVSGGDYKVEVDVAGEGKVTYVLADRKEVKQGDLIRFTLNSKGELVAEHKLNSLDTNIETDLQIVTAEVDKDYLQIGDTSYLVDEKETAIYKVDKDGDLDGTMRLSRIKKGDVVLLIVDEDNKSVIKALVVVTENHKDFDSSAQELAAVKKTAEDAQADYKEAGGKEEDALYVAVTEAIKSKNVSDIKAATAKLVEATKELQNNTTEAQKLAAATEKVVALEAAVKRDLEVKANLETAEAALEAAEVAVEALKDSKAKTDLEGRITAVKVTVTNARKAFDEKAEEGLVEAAEEAVTALETAVTKDLEVEANLVAAEAALEAAQTAVDRLADDVAPATTKADLQEKIDDVKTTVTDAREAFDAAAKVVADAKKLLSAWIKDAEALVESDYTAGSWAEADIENVLANAKTVLADSNDATEVQEATDALKAAIKELVKR